MARYDFVETAASGYRFVWRERRKILVLLPIPLTVKIGSYAVISLLGLEDNFLRQGLVMLPAFFLEGFIVALVIRMAMFGEDFSHLFRGGEQARRLDLRLRHSIMACAVIYLLTKLVSTFFAGLMLTAQKMEPIPSMTPSETSSMTSALMILVFMVWAFRFFWLYVPAVMDVPVRDFLFRIRSFFSSFSLLGIWVICSVPVTLLLLGVLKALVAVFGEGSFAYMILLAFFNASFELGLAMILAVAMAHAVRDIMAGKP